MSENVNDDRFMVQRMLAGEERAFQAFFETYFRASTDSRCRASTGNAEYAKDVRPRPRWIKAMRKLGDFRGEASRCSPGCARFCRREIADHVADGSGRHSEKVVLDRDSAEVRAASSRSRAPAGDDPLRPLVRRGAQAARARGAGPAAESLWRGAEWKYVEGRSVEEIGDRLGIATPPRSRCWRGARWRFGTDSKAVFAHPRPTCWRPGSLRGNTNERRVTHRRSETTPTSRHCSPQPAREACFAGGAGSVRAAVEAEWRATVTARQRRATFHELGRGGGVAAAALAVWVAQPLRAPGGGSWPR